MAPLKKNHGHHNSLKKKWKKTTIHEKRREKVRPFNVERRVKPLFFERQEESQTASYLKQAREKIFPWQK